MFLKRREKRRRTVITLLLKLQYYKIKKTNTNLQKYFYPSSENHSKYAHVHCTRTMLRTKKGSQKVPVLKTTKMLCPSRKYYYCMEYSPVSGLSEVSWTSTCSWVQALRPWWPSTPRLWVATTYHPTGPWAFTSAGIILYIQY